MHDGLVRLVPQKCTTCGNPVVRPMQINKETPTETIVEAVWNCSRCGSKFATGIVSRMEKKHA